MSVKAVKKYYDEICEQYHEMVENLKDIEASVADEMISPERIEMLRKQIEPLKQNYERWAYMMFLLNQPERSSKHKRYQSQNRRLLNSLSNSNSLNAVIQENNDVLEKMHI